MKKLFLLLQFYLFFSSSIYAQSIISGGTSQYTLLYIRTRCIECTFYGCISIKQEIWRNNQTMQEERREVEIRAFPFPCACNTGPIEPNFTTLNGGSPVPWNRIHTVITPNGVGNLRDYTTGENHDEMRRALIGNWTDNDIFSLPPEYFTRLLVANWPNAYIGPNGNVIKQPFPILPCGTAKPNQFSSQSSTEKLNELINKLKEKVAQGQSTDPIQSWLYKIEKEFSKLANGQAVTILDNSFIDFGRGINHAFFGGCYQSEAHWWDERRKLKIKGVLLIPTCNNNNSTPTDYSDPNIWQQAFPVSSVTIINLLNGENFENSTYHLQGEIEINVEHIPTGSFIAVVIQLFDGRKFIQKIVK